MIIFQPEEERQVYGKKYLHTDEGPYFVSGSHFPECRRRIATGAGAVTEAGGEVLVERIDIEFGVISYIMDTEGNKVGLYAQA